MMKNTDTDCDHEQILITVKRIQSTEYPLIPSTLIENIIRIEKEYVDVPEDALRRVQQVINDHLNIFK